LLENPVTNVFLLNKINFNVVNSRLILPKIDAHADLPESCYVIAFSLFTLGNSRPLFDEIKFDVISSVAGY
jgi:hypothetical protein